MLGTSDVDCYLKEKIFDIWRKNWKREMKGLKPKNYSFKLK